MPKILSKEEIEKLLEYKTYAIESYTFLVSILEDNLYGYKNSEGVITKEQKKQIFRLVHKYELELDTLD